MTGLSLFLREYPKSLNVEDVEIAETRRIVSYISWAVSKGFFSIPKTEVLPKDGIFPLQISPNYLPL